MDPLTISVSVVGLLGAAGKIASVLTKVIGATKDAPVFAHSILQEVSDISATLGQLQAFLSGTRAGSRSRMAMLMMEQITVTLTNCVMTFSELEELLAPLEKEPPETIRNRIIWASKQTTLAETLQRLQSSKLSMTLMLTTLTWYVLLTQPSLYGSDNVAIRDKRFGSAPCKSLLLLSYGLTRCLTLFYVTLWFQAHGRKQGWKSQFIES